MCMDGKDMEQNPIPCEALHQNGFIEVWLG
jgi:hypothetical protein